MRKKLTDINPLPDMALPYLKKMEQICNENQIKLHLVASPVSEEYNYEDRLLYQVKLHLTVPVFEENDIDYLQVGMNELSMTDLYEELISSMQNVEADGFIDGVHLNNEYVLENRETFVANVLSGGGG